MLFTETNLKGAYLIDIEEKADDRGFFARAWCQNEFHERNLPKQFVQSNISWNKRKGTLRGMHRQRAPHEEGKLVRCTRGAIYDVILDLRSDSSTFGNWLGFELTEKNHRSLFVPKGFAVGFQTLADESEVLYLMSEFYIPGAEQGIRYNDPTFRFEWPTEVTVISEKDRSWPDYSETKAIGTT